METPAPTGLPARIAPARAVEALGAVALILWRLWDTALVGVWRDWLMILGVFWLIEAVAPEHRWRRPLAIATVAALAALYAVGQVPHLRWLLTPSP
jgi:hypothetical protein